MRCRPPRSASWATSIWTPSSVAGISRQRSEVDPQRLDVDRASSATVTPRRPVRWGKEGRRDGTVFDAWSSIPVDRTPVADSTPLGIQPGGGPALGRRVTRTAEIGGSGRHQRRPGRVSFAGPGGNRAGGGDGRQLPRDIGVLY